MLSGEVERTYRLVRLEGGAAQMAYHSPTSQYGQMSRADSFGAPRPAYSDPRAHRGDLLREVRRRVGRERDAGYPRLEALRAKTVSPEILAFEADEDRASASAQYAGTSLSSTQADLRSGWT